VFPAATDQQLVAALVRARSTGFKPKDRAGVTSPRRAVDCAPYLTLRLSVSAVKRSRARKGAENRIQT